MRGCRLPVVVVLLLVVLAACANSGAPTVWEDNPADYQFNPDDENSPVEPNVGQAERNFRNGCRDSGEDDLADEVIENLAHVCKCSFDAIRETLSFEEFKELDKDLRGNINHDLPEPVEAGIAKCIRDQAGI